MNNKLIISLFAIIISCQTKKNDAAKDINDIRIPKFEVEKFIVLKNQDFNEGFFKIKIENINNRDLIFKDYSILDQIDENNIKGFFLNGEKKTPLSLTSQGFYIIKSKCKGYMFLKTINLTSSIEKDSIEIKKYIIQNKICYEASSFNIDSIVKNKYISEYDYNIFLKHKKEYYPFKKKISFEIPKNVKIKFINEIPSKINEWNEL